MSTRQFLSPEKVSATYRYECGLTIKASGHESGVENIRIRSAGSMPIEFPIFMVEADEISIAGVLPYDVLPYDVRTEFKVCRIPDTIVMHSSNGSKHYPVRVESATVVRR